MHIGDHAISAAQSRAVIVADGDTISYGELYARSERSAGWMKLASNAEDVVKEADKVVAGE